MNTTKILILCTGNSCRSQMAEGFLKAMHPEAEVYSAGTQPADVVHPKAIQVMNEAGIDISGQKPQLVDKFLGQNFDYVITVCDDANETCPAFIGNVKHRLHIGFEDPAKAEGNNKFIISRFRRIRDEIKKEFHRFIQTQINTG